MRGSGPPHLGDETRHQGPLLPTAASNRCREAAMLSLLSARMSTTTSRPAAARAKYGTSPRVVRQLLGAFATEDHPLALVLDDLQWADPASLKALTEWRCRVLGWVTPWKFESAMRGKSARCRCEITAWVSSATAKLRARSFRAGGIDHELRRSRARPLHRPPHRASAPGRDHRGKRAWSGRHLHVRLPRVA
jgi:hypothetical protein